MEKVRIDKEMRELEVKIRYHFNDISWLAKAMKSVIADKLYRDGIRTKGQITAMKSDIENNASMHQMMIKEGFINYSYNDLHFYKDPNIPESWVWCKLSDIGTTNIGLTYHPEDIVDEGTMVIRSSNIINVKLDYKDKVCVNCSIKPNQYLNDTDIVICSRNGSKNLVGKNAIYRGENELYSFGAFMAVFRTLFYEFVHLYFNTDAFKDIFPAMIQNK